MKIAVGCPIRNRAWVFPHWEIHVRNAFKVAGLDPVWVFAIGVGPNGTDDGTQKMVTDLFRTEPGMWTEISEPNIPDRQHAWNDERLKQMSSYRNRLLQTVRAVNPDYFLSVDSDILLHPSTLMCLLETIEKEHKIAGVPCFYDAVGGKAFLSTASRHITTYANKNPMGGLRRQDADGVFPVEILMAVKLMSRAAYNIDYSFDHFGEDIGWSDNCRVAGLKLGWDGRVTSKHVMQREMLDKVDRRVGW